MASSSSKPPSPSVLLTSEQSFDSALLRFKNLESKLSDLRPTYALSAASSIFDDDDDDSAADSSSSSVSSVVDTYRFPPSLDSSYITPTSVHLPSNQYSASWLVVLHRVFSKLSLRPSDTLVHLCCGDGHWLVEASVRHGVSSVGYDSCPSLEYRCGRRAEEQQVGHRVEFRIVEDLVDADLSDASVVFFTASRENNTSALRAHLEESLSPLCPVVVFGGAIVGWTAEWTDRHRGTAINLYRRLPSSGGVLVEQEAKLLRSKGRYNSPYDRVVSLVSNGSSGGGGEEDDGEANNADSSADAAALRRPQTLFHLEDLGTEHRAEGAGGNGQYEPRYKAFVHTPHPFAARK